jgi:hypothetical protein
MILAKVVVDGRSGGLRCATDSQLMADSSAGFTSEVTMLRAIARLAWAVLHTEWVVLIKDVA